MRSKPRIRDAESKRAIKRERIKLAGTLAIMLLDVVAGAATIYSLLQGASLGIRRSIFLLLVILGAAVVASSLLSFAINRIAGVVDLSEAWERLVDNYIKERRMLLERLSRCAAEVDAKRCIMESCHFLNARFKVTAHEYYGCSVRSCIKTMVNSETQELITYCRDDVSVDESCLTEHEETISVMANSDFNDIFNCGEPRFVGSNLKKKYRKGSYKNTNSDFEYDSALVYPIMEVHSQNGSERRIIIGFLCLDSHKKRLFNGRRTDSFAHLMSSYSKLLYRLIRECDALIADRFSVQIEEDSLKKE